MAKKIHERRYTLLILWISCRASPNSDGFTIYLADQSLE